MSDEEEWERRRAALDEYLADMAYERLKEVHDRCHQELRDDCKFCKEEKEQENGE
jgi:hypothetical protein